MEELDNSALERDGEDAGVKLIQMFTSQRNKIVQQQVQINKLLAMIEKTLTTPCEKCGRAGIVRTQDGEFHIFTHPDTMHACCRIEENEQAGIQHD